MDTDNLRCRLCSVGTFRGFQDLGPASINIFSFPGDIACSITQQPWPPQGPRNAFGRRTKQQDRSLQKIDCLIRRLPRLPLMPGGQGGPGGAGKAGGTEGAAKARGAKGRDTHLLRFFPPSRPNQLWNRLEFDIFTYKQPVEIRTMTR